MFGKLKTQVTMFLSASIGHLHFVAKPLSMAAISPEYSVKIVFCKYKKACEANHKLFCTLV